MRTLRERGLCREGDRVAIAISGGADSVALAFALRELPGTGGPEVAGLIHLNHSLRGTDSDGDEAFCRDLADRLGWRIEVARADIRSEAQSRRTSIEVAARDARYAFFPRAAEALGATIVATAHTLDDQVETILMRLLRGTAGRGVAGIPARRGIYIRPLIEVRRAEVRTFLSSIGERWREDATNDDTSIPRNRIRHELLPVIERIAPSGPSALARFARMAADDEAVLEQAAIEMLPDVVLSDRDRPGAGPKSADGVTLSAARLAEAPPALGRRIVRRVIEEVAAGTPSAGDIEAVRALASADTPESAAVDLRRVRVVRSGAILRLEAAARRSSEVDGFCRRLEIPGPVSIPEAGVVITARSGVVPEWPLPASTAQRAVVAASAVQAPLVVRSWRPGDRIHPLGGPGRRKLQDLFVDRRIPRGDRRHVPVIEDAAGCILWVAGVAVAESGRVGSPEASVVILELRKDQ